MLVIFDPVMSNNYLFMYAFKKIEMKFMQHKINHFKGYISVAFTTFTVLYNYHPY